MKALQPIKGSALRPPSVLLLLLALTAVPTDGQTPRDERLKAVWITTRQPFTLLSANDG